MMLSLFSPSQREKLFSFILILFFLFASLSGPIYSYFTGILPCSLCKIERFLYQVSLFLLIINAYFLFLNKFYFFRRFLLFFIFILMLGNLFLSFFHIGLEQKLWKSNICQFLSHNSIKQAQSPQELIKMLSQQNNHSCGSTIYKFLKLPLTVWNALLSFFLDLLIFYGIIHKWHNLRL